ncbi:acyl-CoA thioesterase [Leptolyngbya sp. KIOST-1]|uniref:acyl-CoA thioesterase n=1 Tax=Leptolyngbya sp. KIOST-1 TaxID=1229172 RepID=UPI001CEC971D|nr:thioesterase family protein [Leptolyngbya sp. KIOST-1]
MQKLTYDLEVYTYQIDFAGHVNNSVYIHWMEIGRLKLLEAIGMPIHEVVNQGIAPVLVETNIIYKLPLYLGDRVQAQTPGPLITLLILGRDATEIWETGAGKSLDAGAEGDIPRLPTWFWILRKAQVIRNPSWETPIHDQESRRGVACYAPTNQGYSVRIWY